MSAKEERKHHKAPREMRVAEAYLLTGLQWPLLVKIGLKYWNMKTVPVGKKFDDVACSGGSFVEGRGGHFVCFFASGVVFWLRSSNVNCRYINR